MVKIWRKRNILPGWNTAHGLARFLPAGEQTSLWKNTRPAQFVDTSSSIITSWHDCLLLLLQGMCGSHPFSLSPQQFLKRSFRGTRVSKESRISETRTWKSCAGLGRVVARDCTAKGARMKERTANRKSPSFSLSLSRTAPPPTWRRSIWGPHRARFSGWSDLVSRSLVYVAFVNSQQLNFKSHEPYIFLCGSGKCFFLSFDFRSSDF